MDWHKLIPWIIFNGAVIALLTIDLSLLRKKSHEIKIKEALLQTLFWISLALIFGAGVFWVRGKQPALEFLTGYVLEESLSIDNLFVFILVFDFFHIPARLYHKVLFWGILGALIMRAIFILSGLWLIAQFHFLIYIFGGFLIYTGIKLAFESENDLNPEQNPVLKLIRRFFPVTQNVEDECFLVKINGKVHLTPILVTLIFINVIDLVFAMDSIPAVLSVSRDPFIVYTSNIFAILGLRALFFVISGLMKMFEYLNYGLAAVLIFIGTKMLIADHFQIPIGISLGIVAGLIGSSILISAFHKTTTEKKL